MSAKKKNKIKYSASEHFVHWTAGILTLFWIFCLFFPIYWLVITSFKDTSDALAETPSFVPSTSDDYNILVEYDEEVWKQLDTEDFQEDMNILLWSNFRANTSGKIGELKVYAFCNDELVGSAVLPKSSYTLNITRIFDTTGQFTPDIIKEGLSKINELTAVKYNTLSKLPSENKLRTDETTETMTQLIREYQSDLNCRLIKVNANDDWTNFVQNYIAAWEYPISQGIDGGLPQAIKNSCIIAFSIVFGQWLVCGLAGYSLSKMFSPRWGRRILLAFMATSMVPSTVTIVASYLCLQKIGIAENMLGVILPLTCNAGNILLFKGNFDGIPTEMVEAARIDGASEFGVFARIVMPNSKPIFVTIGLLTFGSGWGEFFWSNIILRDRSQYTVPIVLKTLYGTSGASTNYPMLMAMSLIISVPTILIMIFGQKDLSKGMVYTGLKG